MTQEQLIRRAVSLAGGTHAAARATGVTPSAISHMMQRGRVSAIMAYRLEKITGIDKSKLCPEAFGDEK